MPYLYESNASPPAGLLIQLEQEEADSVQSSYSNIMQSLFVPTSPRAFDISMLLNQAAITHITYFDLRQSTDSQGAQFRHSAVIREIQGEPYRIKQPIPIAFRQCDPSGIEASFVAANIAWVGETWIEAFNGLQAEILNTFEDYEDNEHQLGPEPLRQLAELRGYIERIE